MKWAKPRVVACRTTCIRDAVPETVLWARGGEQAVDCQNRAAETALLDIIVPQLTFAFWSMKGGFREDVDYDHACRNEGQANDCWNV